MSRFRPIGAPLLRSAAAQVHGYSSDFGSLVQSVKPEALAVSCSVQQLAC
ncbi:hypothetical protein [Paenibacillus sp. FSL H8-0537]